MADRTPEGMKILDAGIPPLDDSYQVGAGAAAMRLLDHLLGVRKRCLEVWETGDEHGAGFILAIQYVETMIRMHSTEDMEAASKVVGTPPGFSIAEVRMADGHDHAPFEVEAPKLVTAHDACAMEATQLADVVARVKALRDYHAEALKESERLLSAASGQLEASKARLNALGEGPGRTHRRWRARNAVESLLEAHPDRWFGSKEVASLIGMPKATARYVMIRMVEAGKAETTLLNPENKRGGVAKGYRRWRWACDAEAPGHG